MKKILILFVISGVFLIPNNSKAIDKKVEVNTIEELQKEILVADEAIDILLGSDFPKQEKVEIELSLENRVKIDGDNQKYENKFYFFLTDEGNNGRHNAGITLENFHFDGGNEKSVGVVGDFSKTNLLVPPHIISIYDSTFERSNGNTIKFIGNENVTDNNQYTALLLGVKVRNNTTKDFAAIQMIDMKYLHIGKSIIENNVNKGDQGAGGVISIIGDYNQLNIFETAIINNSLEGKHQFGGGAISLVGDENFLSTYTSWIENNKSNQSGGAISIVSKSTNTKSKTDNKNFANVHLNQSLFSNNDSIGNGATFYFDNKVSSELFTKINTNYSFFYGNKSSKSNSGSAFFIENNENDKVTSSINNTTIYHNNSKDTLDNGGAIYSENKNGNWEFNDSIIIDNKGKKNYENLYLPNSLVKNNKSLGIDNGKAISETASKIFGKYPVGLTTNNGELYVGTDDDQRIIPSLSVIPKFSDKKGVVTNGIADIGEAVNNSSWPNGDLRGKKPKFLVLGAVNSTSILYDANDGVFSMPELKSFTGKEYYESNKPQQIAQLFTPGTNRKIKNGIKDFNISRKGYSYLGWSIYPDSRKNKQKYDIGEEIKDGPQVKLYAIWKINSYSTKYYGNGNTSGTPPQMVKSKFNSKVKVKNRNNLKRKGYSFIGWATRPNSSKQDVKFAPGSNIILKNNIKLYAVWKKAK